MTCGVARKRAERSRQPSMPLFSFSDTLMCAIAPSRLRSSVLRKPVVTAMAMTSAITPTATPSTEMAVMTEITDAPRCARK